MRATAADMSLSVLTSGHLKPNLSDPSGGDSNGPNGNSKSQDTIQVQVEAMFKSKMEKEVAFS